MVAEMLLTFFPWSFVCRPEILDNRADSSSLGERPMNLVLLGQEPLATQVYKEIRVSFVSVQLG